MLPTGSSTERATECPASHALPQVDGPAGEAAERGTVGHRYLERIPQVGAEKALVEAADGERDWLSEVVLDGLPLGEGWRQEVAFGLDLATGKATEIGSGLQRRYERRPGCVYATIDVCRRDGSMAKVLDYKFELYDNRQRAPRESAQLLTCALLVARAWNVSTVAVGFVHVRSNGTHWTEMATLDAFDLDAHFDTLRETAARIAQAEERIAAGQTPDVKRGPWCRWCKSVAACPAVTSLVRAVSQAPAATAQSILDALTPDTAALAYRRLQEVEDALKPVRAALYLYGSEVGVDLGEGRVYGAVTTQRESIDGRIARKVLAQLVAPEVAESAVEFSTSKAAIERALRPVAKAKKEAGEKVTLAALQRQALEEIARAGGVETKTTTVVREHSVKTTAAEAVVDTEAA